IIYWFLLVVVMPVIFVIIAFLMSSKNIDYYTLTFIIIFCFSVFYIGLSQIKSSKVNVSDGSLIIKSTFYKDIVLISSIDNIEVVDELVNKNHLMYRSNGISMTGYKIGYFTLTNHKKAFLYTTEPPYLVINTQNQTVIISKNNLSNDDLNTLLGNK
ncbi:PH domain-containing protein, partial [Photobacterium kishitanii]